MFNILESERSIRGDGAPGYSSTAVLKQSADFCVMLLEYEYNVVRRSDGQQEVQ